MKRKSIPTMMNARRIASAVLLMLAFCSAATAQLRLDILLKNKDVLSCPLDDIDYIEVVEGAAAGQLDGYWYLGWKVMQNGSGTKSHFNGTEMLVFSAGPKMKWIKSSTESVYNLTYDEEGAVGGASFVGVRDGSTTKYTYQILALEKDFLLLRQGTTRYYFYKTKKAATEATDFVAYPTRNIYTDSKKLWDANIKGGSTFSQITPMGKHFERYAAATDEDKAWLADPKNQPDANWLNIGDYKTWTAKTITLYPFSNMPTPADVNQHAIGDCCMCAVFASFAYIYPEWIKSIIEKDGNNYTVHMFDPLGNPIDVVVDNKLLCKSGGECAQVSSKNGKFNWASIMEKALMKWETRFKCNNLGGIGTEHAAPPFTGNGNSYSFGWSSTPYLFNSEYPLIVDYALSNGMISVGGFHESGVMCGELETVTGHAFTVMYPDEGADYSFVMRNPWGNGGYPIDGKLKIPNNYEVLRLMDFRLVYPGAQMAQYKKENLGGYTAPRFKPMPIDMNPSEEMLRMYGVTNYIPFPMPDEAEADIEDEFVPDTEE